MGGEERAGKGKGVRYLFRGPDVSSRGGVAVGYSFVRAPACRQAGDNVGTAGRGVKLARSMRSEMAVLMRHSKSDWGAMRIRLNTVMRMREGAREYRDNTVRD